MSQFLIHLHYFGPKTKEILHTKEVKETTFTNDEVGDEVKLEKIIHANILNIGYVDEGDN